MNNSADRSRNRHSTFTFRLMFALLVLPAGEAVAAPSAALPAVSRSLPGDDSLEVGLAAGERMLWVFENRAGAVRLAYRGLGERTATRFHGVRNVYSGRIARSAVRGSDLHVFFGDGTHRRFSAAAYESRPWTVPVYHVERNLPGDARVPILLAGDIELDVLFAVVSRQQATEVATLARSILADKLAMEANDNSAVGEAAEPATFGEPEPLEGYAAEIGYFVVRYENGQWGIDRPIPAEMASDVDFVRLVARRGDIHLLYSPTDGRRLLHRQSGSSGEPFGSPNIVTRFDEEQRIGAGFSGADLVLSRYQHHSDGNVIHTFLFSQGEWREGRGPSDSNGSPTLFTGELSTAVVDTRLFVALATQESSASVGAWSVPTGESIEEWLDVAPLRSRNPQPTQHAIRVIVQYALLAAALGGVFIWRKGSVVQAMSLASHHTFARLSYRFVAFFIDTAILMPVWAPVLYKLLFPEDGSPTVFEQLQMGGDELSAQVFWSRAIVGGVFAVYGTFFEQILGATPGKRIAGLAVVCAGGEPRRFGPVLVRNLARVVEFQFYPLALLVVLTPSRQRLGDLLGGTVVVEPSYPEGQPPCSDDGIDD